MARMGNLLIALGVGLLVAAGLWQTGLLPGSRVSLPEPVALRHPQTPLVAPPAPTSPVLSTVDLSGTPAPLAATPAPTGAPTPQPDSRVPPWRAADQQDRVGAAGRPRVGYAVRLAIPAIQLETPVKQAGVKRNPDGSLEWETLPFVAVHYGDLTALAGGPGNAVIAGHVVTLNEGNVFRSLYQVELDDEVLVWAGSEHEEPAMEPHRYRVAQVMLVPPTHIAVMARTATPTLTLITCGGTFDPVTREFSHRLVVVAKPIHHEASTMANGT